MAEERKDALSSKVTRRDFLARTVGAATGLGLVLAGCAPSPTQSSPGSAAAKPPAGGGAAAAPTAAPAGAAGGGIKERTLRLNHTFGPSGAVFELAEKFKSLVEERSGGKIKVQNNHTGQLGAEKDGYDSLQLGNLELHITGSLIIATLAPEYQALDMPYIFDDQAHFRRAVDGSIGQEMHKVFLDKKGNRNLVVTNRMPRHLTTKNREVKTPDDLKGLKLRTLEVPVHVSAWKALGANPVPMAFPEVFTALQQGTLDAQENPYDVTFANNFFEVQKYLILTGHVRSGNWLNISDKVWQTFSTEEKDLVSTAAKDAGKYADEKNDGFDKEFSQKLKDKGMTFVEPQLALFRDKVKDVPNEFKSIWKPGLYDEIRKMAKG